MLWINRRYNKEQNVLRKWTRHAKGISGLIVIQQ